MASSFQIFWGVGPHTLYHSFGQEVVVAIYDSDTNEQIKGAVIKNYYDRVEVTLPAGNPYGCRVVVVG